MFGSSNTGFNFGQTPAQQQTTNAPTFGTSTFGTTPGQSSIFGSPSTQQQPTQQQPSLFGTPQQQPSTGFGLSFGNTQSSTSAFGSTNTAAPGTTSFFQPISSASQTSTGFSFGSTSNTTGFGFGAQQQQQQQPGTSILAPQTATQTNQPSLFGQPANTSLSTGSFFASKPAATATTTAPSTGFGNFGTSSFGLNFGSSNLATSAPSATTITQPAQQQSSIFGQTPAFGSFTQPATTTNTTLATSTGITTAFGSSTTVPSFGNLSIPASSTSNVPATTTTTSSFNFGTTPSLTDNANKPPAPAFGTSTFGQQTTTASLQFGTPTTTTITTTAASSIPSLVSQAATTATTAAPATTTLSGFNFGTQPQTSTTTAQDATKPAFGVPSTTAATTTIQPAPTTTSLTFGSTKAPSIQQPSITQSSTNTQLSSSLKPNTGFIITTLGSTTSQTTSTTTTTSTATSGSTPQITFGQLEDQINIWMNELSQFEADFHSQSQTINSWDSLLISNGQKLIEMDGMIDKLKYAHRGIDHQLDFIIAQQKELEQLLEQVEQDKKLDFGSTNVNAEREYTYSLVETVHNDLTAIGSDLKDFIKKLNETKSNHDSNDPMIQILKILNSHMDVLQWMENQIKNIKVN